MKTLVELYDERAIENVIGPEMFTPQRVIYLCPPEIAQDRQKIQILRDYFAYRGLQTELEFIEISIYKTDKILRQLRRIAERFPGCALDVTGGTDAALFAAGMFCQETGVPTFTYSRRKNKFYNIRNADFADERICDLEYRVEDFFRMTGGTLRPGRVDNQILADYIDRFDPFFEVFLRYRHQWADQIACLQRLTHTARGTKGPLYTYGSCEQTGEQGEKLRVNPRFLKELEKIGFLYNLEIRGHSYVSFSFADHQIRAWLRDVGSVLELYMYKLCLESGVFSDVVSSAVVDWFDGPGYVRISNEIDVVAVRGCVPIFISCKVSDIKTRAINELAVLRDRFGGKGAKAVIVTTEICNAAARHRAAQMGIAVIDIEELAAGKASERLLVIMKLKEQIRE